MRPSIHPDALAYERSRPGYRAEAVDALVTALPGRDVIDLAAGTGKLTRDLLARGLDVVAVEPRAELRAAIEPPARVLEGPRRRSSCTRRAPMRLRSHCEPANAYRSEGWRSAFDGDRRFGPLDTQVFDNERVLGADELAQHVGARPFVAVLEDAERVPLLDAVRALAADDP